MLIHSRVMSICLSSSCNQIDITYERMSIKKSVEIACCKFHNGQFELTNSEIG